MILVVDDHIDTATVLARLLRMQGYEASTAFCGKDALAAMRQSRPRLLITDCMMPDIDGPELVRLARAEGLLGTVPVLFYSAAADPDVKADAMRNGAAGWVT